MILLVLCGDLHLYILEEREHAPLLFDGLPKDIRERYSSEMKVFREKFLGSSDPDDQERVQMEVDSLKDLWETLQRIRRDKLLDKAIIHLDGEKAPDLSGILPWEQEHYSKIVEVLALLEKSYGAVQ